LLRRFNRSEYVVRHTDKFIPSGTTMSWFTFATNFFDNNPKDSDYRFGQHVLNFLVKDYTTIDGHEELWNTTNNNIVYDYINRLVEDHQLRDENGVIQVTTIADINWA
jgi:hypothetical protein